MGFMDKKLYLKSWFLRSKLKSHQILVETSKRIIRKSISHNLALCWSGGKDSTAMVHLVRSIAPDIPIIIQFDDCDWPEKRLYIERVCKMQKWSIHEVWPSFSIWDAAIKTDLGNVEICAQSHKITKKGFIEPLQDKVKELGCEGVYMGLRAQESHGRSCNLHKRGQLYQISSGQWRCCPLAWWKVEDVFAYLVSHEIEINPCYFNNKFRSPEEIRLAWALPTPLGMGTGDMEHIKYYYPEQFRRLQDVICY
jgi:3'-phosphoadenosine 5'-phosphosulfate sulfotransferase (PAPS reductase)/FAD synthetase